MRDIDPDSEENQEQTKTNERATFAARMMHRPKETQPDDNALDLIGFNVVEKPYSSVKAIMAEFHQDEQLLLAALKIGHNVTIEPGTDPMLFIVVDELTKAKLAAFRVDNPTWMQLIGTAQVIALDKSAAISRFRTLMQPGTGK